MAGVTANPAADAPSVLVAVKDLGRAKSRLAPALDAGRRAALAGAMLADTVLAALRVGADVRVVTPDARAARIARELGAAVVADEGAGLNAALARAARRARGTVVALHADLPCLLPSELAEAVAAAVNSGSARAFVADRHGIGTCALIACDGPLAPLFGDGSAARHRASGAAELAGEWPGLRTDVDVPDDIAAAWAAGVGAATREVLAAWPELLGGERAGC
jgi:2-phospho-L-lactate guanylyltransferase